MHLNGHSVTGLHGASVGDSSDVDVTTDVVGRHIGERVVRRWQADTTLAVQRLSASLSSTDLDLVGLI